MVDVTRRTPAEFKNSRGTAFSIKRSGKDTDIVSIDFEQFSVYITEGGLFNLYLNFDVEFMEQIEEIDHDALQNIIQKYPNKCTFLTKNSLIEFIAINILPYLEQKNNPYDCVDEIP